MLVIRGRHHLIVFLPLLLLIATLWMWSFPTPAQPFDMLEQVQVHPPVECRDVVCALLPLEWRNVPSRTAHTTHATCVEERETLMVPCASTVIAMLVFDRIDQVPLLQVHRKMLGEIILGLLVDQMVQELRLLLHLHRQVRCHHHPPREIVPS